jgi:uncharacterized membrane protein YqjE
MPPYERGFDGGGVPLHEAPTSVLVRELVAEGKRLVRGEVQLAKAEIKDDVKKSAEAASYFGGASVIAHGAFLALVAAIILALATTMRPWLAAGIVGVVLLVVAAALASLGRNKLKEVSGVKETTQTVKEDARWASETMRVARSKSHATT